MASGNSLDFDWRLEKFKNWNQKGYDDFRKSVGWKGQRVDGQEREELPMNLVKREGDIISMRGELPYWSLRELYGWISGALFSSRETCKL